jgi:hypothetical protein
MAVVEEDIRSPVNALFYRMNDLFRVVFMPSAPINSRQQQDFACTDPD